jgi:SAM-dependent methyltransferase
MAADQKFLPALRFRALTPIFDPFARATVRESTLKQRLLDGIDLRRDARVLDLGAGTGTLAIQIKQRWPDATVTGLDADPEILDIARRKAAEAGVELELVEGFSNELPFADASFDAVVSTLFFHHLTGDVKRATLAEVARVLRPGGVLHVGDWGKPRDALQATGFFLSRVFDGFEVTRDNARGALPGLIAAAGLRSVAVSDRLRTAFGTLDLIRATR